MLDFRHETFLALCKIKSYTKTAAVLHITQPAVTQHIKTLEAFYGNPLFIYEDRTLKLTAHGALLYHFASTMASDSDTLVEILKSKTLSDPPLRFGATLSIGQYVMPEILKKTLVETPNIQVSMVVENTQHLLEKLDTGEIQFAIIEGLFDKNAYHTELFFAEPFICVCAPSFALQSSTLSFGEIMQSNLLIREKGSGTREIFEHMLHKNNLTISGFAGVIEIGNMEAIKELVKAGLGITFLYQTAAQKELESGELMKVDLKELNSSYEFNFVFPKNSRHSATFLSWLDIFKENRL